eukprot:CAMPEP_0202695806 /NCGR_PEP_ID=MMETSP1385-20130828/9292_1 /ASSEMBLY_ACC=CAM_ASM_000861 /TAXON_ID=933848 /ORGANISM="Elphidium margaritaceum" /LENGTH=566 /DNA_ID=CAMNT_0049351883 /DNA_START=32 /DNA_END=1732 /DNA_ORIENTATION=+
MATMPFKNKTLQSPQIPKMHQTSINLLAMDVLTLLDSVDAIDMAEADEDTFDLNSAAQYESKQADAAEEENRQLRGGHNKKASAHKFVKQIKDQNLRKLMFMQEQELEDSVSNQELDIVSPMSSNHETTHAQAYPHTYHGHMQHDDSDMSDGAFDFCSLQNAHTYHAPASTTHAIVSSGPLFSQSAMSLMRPNTSKYKGDTPINLTQSHSPRTSSKLIEDDLVEDPDFDTIGKTRIAHTRSRSASLTQTSSVYIERPIKLVARMMYDLVDKQDRKYKRRTYTDCFVAREAVTVMDQHGLCLHRFHGVSLFREMEQRNIIHHVLYEKGGRFCDDRHCLYQFTIDDDGQQQQQQQQQARKKKDLDVAFGLMHEVDTQKLVHLSKNNASIRQLLHDDAQANDGVLPQFTKLPSEAIACFDLKQVKRARLSTMKDFRNAQNEVLELPELSGFMFKRSSTGFHQWQRRWVIVRRTHILWSSRQTDTTNPLDPKERAKFNNSFTLLTVKGVRPVSSRGKRKFDVILPNSVYHFRCLTPEQRTLWLNGLQQHLKALTDSMRFLRRSVFFDPNK